MCPHQVVVALMFPYHLIWQVNYLAMNLSQTLHIPFHCSNYLLLNYWSYLLRDVCGGQATPHHISMDEIAVSPVRMVRRGCRASQVGTRFPALMSTWCFHVPSWIQYEGYRNLSISRLSRRPTLKQYIFFSLR